MILLKGVRKLPEHQTANLLEILQNNELSYKKASKVKLSPFPYENIKLLFSN
jgi:hypothetical protein